MARQPKMVIVEDTAKYALCIVGQDGRSRWLLDNNADVKLYDSQEIAEKAKKQLMKNSRYSWSEPIEVREFNGFSRKGNTDGQEK